MAIERDDVSLSNGTLVRHRTSGYLGRIDGITAIQSCFTNSGAPVPLALNKDKFQYRVIVRGEKLRRIAPVRDLEVLDARSSVDVTCLNCHTTYSTTSSASDKPGGLCACGGWICPECLLCEVPKEMTVEGSSESCPNQRKRLLKKAADHKQTKATHSSKKPTAPRPLKAHD